MSIKSRWLLIVILSAIVSALVFRGLYADKGWSPEHERRTIASNGVDRSFVLFVPKQYHPSAPIPLLVMLHGMGGTAMNAHQETGWSTKGAAENFIVAYPEGTRPNDKASPSLRKNPQAWNDGSGRFHVAEKNVDDVAFIGSVLECIATDYNIDPRRIYVTGFSNGASMAFRIGAELSDRIAAIAPCAGACWTDELKLSGKLSLCYITGMSDKLNPMEGGYPKLNFGGDDQGGNKKPAVQATMAKWVEALKCKDSPTNDTSTNGVRIR
jgi:polyhydroxybutyrate depolymerase